MSIDSTLFDDATFDLFAHSARRYGVGEAEGRMARMGMEATKLIALRAEYERRISQVEIGYPPLIIAVPHEPWYAGSLEEDVHWPTLRRYLTDGLGWGEGRVDLLEQTASKVVAHTPNPKDARWDCRGLVIGYVQSGKTTNFTAVIAKAADAGYNLVIVLSGIHNGLRRQTQERLNAQLAELSPDRWVTMTTAESDFKRPTTTLSSLLANDRAVLCVVKKNATVLRRLRRWLDQSRSAGGLRDVKALIIDDEADQASVETVTINPLLRAILDLLPARTYIGYTATPFANVLINPAVDDLYPKNFILNIPQPEGYFGTEMIFGRNEIDGDSEDVRPLDGHDMVRVIPDDEAATFRYRRNAPFEPQVSPSLRRALLWFWLATATRRARGDDGHSTMLVHTSMQTAAHRGVKDPIDHFMSRVAKALDANDPSLDTELRAVWADECERVPAEHFSLHTPSYEEVRAQLSRVVWSTKVLLDNSQSLERLSYGSEPVTAIAIGGNTLSRGLTLEGLVVSFFVRGSRAYDTLLQMGRWFGFRQGYEDLPRIWMTSELRDWFRHLAAVEHEIRLDVDRYQHTLETPLDFGPRIRTHPELLVTAKLGSAVVAFTSYGGRRVQTRYFCQSDREWLDTNTSAADVLLSSIRGVEPEKVGSDGALLFRGVEAAHVLRFLKEYRSHPDSPDLDASLLTKYITKEIEARSLLTWNVAVMAAADDSHGEVTLGGRRYGRIVRSRLADGRLDRADIKTLMSKEHRVVDLPLDLTEARHKSEDFLMGEREKDPEARERGLLLLYPLDPVSSPSAATAKSRVELGACSDVIGMALVFPGNAKESVSSSYIQVDLSCVEIEDSEDDVADPVENDLEDSSLGNSEGDPL